MSTPMNFDRKEQERWGRREDAREAERDDWGTWTSSGTKQFCNPKFFHRTGRIPGVWSSKLKLDKRGRYTLTNKHTKSTIKVPEALLTGFWKEIKT